MPKLSITSIVAVPTGYPAYQLSNIQIQDPFPSDGRLVIEVAPGTTVDTDVSADQLLRIRDQLVDLESRSEISWSVSIAAEDRRSEEADMKGDSAIAYLDTSVTPLTHGGAVTGATVVGTKLLLGYVQATKVWSDPAAAAAHLTLKAIDTGADQNLIGVELINDAGVVNPSNIEYAEPTVLPDGYSRVLEIHVLPATFTWVTLATILNNAVNGIYARTAGFPLGSYRIFCSANGASALNPIDQALAPLAGGTGSALVLSVGDTVANVTSHTNTVVTYDVDLTGTAMDKLDTAVVNLRSAGGGPSLSASAVIA